MTMATSWSYAATDTYKPTAQLIRHLVEIVARGGNLLLNIGPSPAGELPPQALDRLAGLAAWMQVNSRAIHDTRAVAPYCEDRACFTRMPDGSVNAIYLADAGETAPPARLSLRAFTPPAGTTVTMLGVAAPVPWRPDPAGFTIEVPESVRAEPPCRHAWAFNFRVD
jgi:alpha-L-fucosidase